jgi:hypothetical protein
MTNAITSYLKSFCCSGSSDIESQKPTASQNIFFKCISYYNESRITPFVSFLITRPLFAYFHESVHALALMILFKNAHPQIFIRIGGFAGGCLPGFEGPSSLSSIGNLLGAGNMVSAVAPIADNIICAVLGSQGNSQGLTRCICLHSFVNLAHALTPFVLPFFFDPENMDGNDFYTILNGSGSMAYGMLVLSTLTTTVALTCKVFEQNREQKKLISHAQ